MPAVFYLNFLVLGNNNKKQGEKQMKAVILADKYSEETIEEIINHYKKYGISNVVICQSWDKEAIEEGNLCGIRVTYAKISNCKSTSGQLLKIRGLLEEKRFFLTLGDFICDIDLLNLLSFHRGQGLLLTVSTIKSEDNTYVNGGFFVVENEIYDYITENSRGIEADVLSRIGEDGEIAFYTYCGKARSIYKKKDLYQINNSKL